jgi:hypothetical protein
MQRWQVINYSLNPLTWHLEGTVGLGIPEFS